MCKIFRFFTLKGLITALSNHAIMMTSSDGNIFRVTGHLCVEFTGEFPPQRPVTRSFDVFFDVRLNKHLSKQSWGWWFETPSRPLWRHSNDVAHNYSIVIITHTKRCSIINYAHNLIHLLRPREDNVAPIYKCIFWNENRRILIQNLFL